MPPCSRPTSSLTISLSPAVSLHFPTRLVESSDSAAEKATEFVGAQVKELVDELKTGKYTP